MSIETVDVNTLSEWLKADDTIQLIDVRELHEREAYNIGGHHLPLSVLNPLACESLDKNKKTVIYCRSGMRSFQACQLFLGLGFSHLFNLEGGMQAWAREMDNAHDE